MSLPTDHAEAANRIRILILTDTAISGSGGSERFLRNLLQRLPPRDFQVTLIQLCTEPGAAERLHQTRFGAVESMTFLPIGSIHGRTGLRGLHQLRHMVHDGHFDIIQSQHESSDVINALLPRGPRRASRISNRRDTGFLKSARLRLLSRLLNRRYDRIVAPSQAILNAVVHTEGVGSTKMQCIPNGVDTERFTPLSAGQRQATRRALGYTGDELLVGCVASLTEVKRHRDLLDAFNRVRRELPLGRLLLVGDGPLRGEIESRSTGMGMADHVRLLGPRGDVHDLLPALDLFVLASATEGLSNAILEAQACGLAVVATKVGGNPDLVDADRGELVPPHDPDRLAAAILRLLRDTGMRALMGASAREHVLRHHSLASMAQAYQALYRELAHG